MLGHQTTTPPPPPLSQAAGLWAVAAGPFEDAALRLLALPDPVHPPPLAHDARFPLFASTGKCVAPRVVI